jgi:hypothetical protein
MACVQILVTFGVEIDQPDLFGNTPLTSAIRRGYSYIAEYLLHSGAKMSNVHPRVILPFWMTDMIAKRQLIMSFTLTLKGVLKRRFGLCKDVTHLIALYFWRMRLK